MTVRQVMAEIEALPPQEQLEVFSSLRGLLEDKPAETAPAYADAEEVVRIAERIMTERAELFKKLAL